MAPNVTGVMFVSLMFSKHDRVWSALGTSVASWSSRTLSGNAQCHALHPMPLKALDTLSFESPRISKHDICTGCGASIGRRFWVETISSVGHGRSCIAIYPAATRAGDSTRL